MTKEILSTVKRLIQEGLGDSIDVEKDTVESVYDKILELVKPVDNSNVGSIITDDIIKAIMSKFDYRNNTFQQDIDLFCSDMNRLLNALMTSDERLLLVSASILIYAKTTDINKNAMNKLINSICSVEAVDTPSIKSEVDLMIELFKNNVIGRSTLMITSTSQMMEVVSSVNDLLGVHCTNPPSANSPCANGYMKTPIELGIKVDKILSINQWVVRGKLESSRDFLDAVESLKIDPNSIDLESFKPTIYDILNIRFCWFFHWIFRMILDSESEEQPKLILSTVTRCLLKTDKEFMGWNYSFLTLIEIILNGLDFIINGKSYYNHIRAKNIHYNEKGPDVPSYLNSVYEQASGLQTNILKSLNKYGFYVPMGKDDGFVLESLLQANSSGINVNQGNCLEGNGSTKDLYESILAMQMLKSVQCLNQAEVSDSSDIKKLLGESFKLSTVLDSETARCMPVEQKLSGMQS